MKSRLRSLTVCIAIPLAEGGLAAFLTRNTYDLYDTLVQPPFSPPGWVFPIVWTILYALMGYASWLVYTAGVPSIQKFRVLCLYALQLAVNFAWPLFFFRWELFLSSFLVILLLWLLIFVTFHLFSHISERAGTLLLPYLLWVTYAAYLNFGIFRLN